MKLKHQIALLIQRLPKKKLYALNSNIEIIKYCHHLTSYQRKINLAGVQEYFSRRPASEVDLQWVIRKLAESQEALHTLKKHVDGLTAAGMEIPKVVWMYWDRGLQASPEVVKLAYQSWKVQNPDWEVCFLDDSSLAQYLDARAIFKLSSVDLAVAHKSDFIRTYLLASRGGVWADSTTFCWQPLSYWLFAETIDTGFFVFRQPEEMKDRQITNWFIASSIGNPITTGIFNAWCDYVFKPRDVVLIRRSIDRYVSHENLSRTGTGNGLLNAMERENGYPYLFYHYIFNDVVSNDGVGPVWRQVELTRNNYAKITGELGGAYVSKQTYKGEYINSSVYASRKKALMDLIGERI